MTKPTLYFDPRALRDAKPLTPSEHVSLWREVLAQWEREKAEMVSRRDGDKEHRYGMAKRLRSKQE